MTSRRTALKKLPCVEFYRTLKSFESEWAFAWRLRAVNGQIILSPHETFISHRNAVESFARVIEALGGVYEIRDLEGIKGDSIKMLEKSGRAND